MNNDSETKAIVLYEKKRGIESFMAKSTTLIFLDFTVGFAAAGIFLMIQVLHVDIPSWIGPEILVASAIFSSALRKSAKTSYEKSVGQPEDEDEVERYALYSHRVVDFRLFTNGLMMGSMSGTFIATCPVLALISFFLYCVIEIERVNALDEVRNELVPENTTKCDKDK